MRGARAGRRMRWQWMAGLVMIVVALQFSSSLRALSMRWIRWTFAGTKETPATEEQQLLVALSSAQQEVERLQSLEGLSLISKQKRYDIQPVEVIGRATVAWSNLFLLDSGTNQGVRIGMPVVTRDGLLIGSIVSVDPITSSFMPITHPATRIAATVLGRATTPALLQGNANLSVELRLIARSVPLEVGDVIITSGLQPLIPRGITIGRVGAIRSTANDIFHEVDVVEFAQAERFAHLGVVRQGY